MKTIALERGLEELKQALEEHGYNTVFADEIDTPVSVYIYQGQNSPGQAGLYSSLDNYMQSESNPPDTAHSGKRQNALSKSCMIETRYTARCFIIDFQLHAL